MVQPHVSGIAMSKIFETSFNLPEGVIVPFVALAEQADAQRQAQALQEQVLQATQTASGIGGDYDLEAATAAMTQPQIQG